eukprot:SAG31_NODE_13428_length_870_cov_0.987030_1_plen_21_part_01
MHSMFTLMTNCYKASKKRAEK